jgi:hypothetical protein
MKNQHRIEFIFKTPETTLETITITVSANSRADRLADLAKKVRGLLELTLFAEPPLSIEHSRDYPLRRHAK